MPFHNPEQKTYFEIDAHEIDTMVHTMTGAEKFEFIADEEKHNGYTPFHGIKAVNHSERIDKYIAGDRWAMATYQWLEHLVDMNALPSGNYLVDHSW